MRLIDADVLVERWKRIASISWNETAVTSWSHAYEEIISEIEEEPKIEAEPKWIPVTERLPEEKASEFSPHYTSSDVVLVSVYSKRYGYEIFKNFLLDGKWICERQMSEYKVLAWMPLPEAYKGE